MQAFTTFSGVSDPLRHSLHKTSAFSFFSKIVLQFSRVGMGIVCLQLPSSGHSHPGELCQVPAWKVLILCLCGANPAQVLSQISSQNRCGRSHSPVGYSVLSILLRWNGLPESKAKPFTTSIFLKSTIPITSWYNYQDVIGIKQPAAIHRLI